MNWNRAKSIGLALLGLLFLDALTHPQWNPVTVAMLVALIAACGWYSVKFWNKGNSSDADRT